ncbi:uncharacterized protein LOC107370526 [Tetranychus urticae]|uniref:uncharacterized protein LOC107370526 n=1 Tax=Tetranychus urticae TaxID=32264 RepID=UPI000D651E71|nr:uncharacterized protein LOC107370526 [Tetranychus urticae]
MSNSQDQIPELPDLYDPIFCNILKFLDNHDLPHFSEVCPHRSDLIDCRAEQVRFLIAYPDDAADYFHYQIEKLNNGVYLLTFTNLLIADITPKLNARVKREHIFELINANEQTLKGLIYNYRDYKGITRNCNQLEMISSNGVEHHVKQNGEKVKQLRLRYYTLGSLTKKLISKEPVNGKKKRVKDVHYFPNLERLNIYNRKDHHYIEYGLKYGPEFTNLKIFESKFYVRKCTTNIYYGFHLIINFCPNLQSAHIEVEADNLETCSSDTPNHDCLQDLVINFCHKSRIKWDDIKQLLFKFKNLKHLALRARENLLDDHILELATNLPNLVLLDVRGCPKLLRELLIVLKILMNKRENQSSFTSTEIAMKSNQIGLSYPLKKKKSVEVSNS